MYYANTTRYIQHVYNIQSIYYMYCMQCICFCVRFRCPTCPTCPGVLPWPLPCPGSTSVACAAPGATSTAASATSTARWLGAAPWWKSRRRRHQRKRRVQAELCRAVQSCAVCTRCPMLSYGVLWCPMMSSCHCTTTMYHDASTCEPL